MAMTRKELQAYKNRWTRVNSAEIEELRRTPLSEKMRQLAALMASVDNLGWRESLREEEEMVRQRWMRLRRAGHAI